MDDETHTFIKERVAAEVNLPDVFAQRLRGDTLSELRDDAQRLAQTLGVSEPPTPMRDRRGRFAQDMNAAIRSRR